MAKSKKCYRLTVGRLNSRTNRITAHLESGKKEFLDIPRKSKINIHDVVDFMYNVGACRARR